MPQHRSRSMLVTLAAAAAAPAWAGVSPHPGLFRYPDVSGEQIVFVYANDLWIVDRGGGEALPLASPPGLELFPRFSPDGKTIAFMGNYDGGQDLYTVAVSGGVPVRVTHHPARETLCDWIGGDRLLFYARGLEGNPRGVQLFTVDAGGGLPEPLPLPYGATGAVSDDGTWLAYTPHTRDHRTWKRYRGGMATDIWLFNLHTHESRKITDWEGTDTIPMWHGQRVYYLSDGGPAHRLNLWSYDTAAGEREQVTRFEDFDVKWPAIGPGADGHGEIVFQNGPALYLLDLQRREPREVKITMPGARPTIRAQRVDVSRQIQSWRISATGKRVVVQARGDVWTLPAEHGSPRNLTRTSGVAERDPSWSPDGRWVAYFSDATGEYELYVAPSDGKGEPRRITTGSRTFYHDPLWSPDSTHIAYGDKAGRLLLATVESGQTTEIARDPWGEVGRPSWSHDSRWLAYGLHDEAKPVTTIRIYDLETGERHRITSGMFDDGSPAFDRTGDHLYFASHRSFSPTYSDLDTTFIYDRSQVLLALPLRADVEAPWPARSDEEEWSEEKAGDEDAAPAGDEDDDEGGGGADDDDAEGDDRAARAEDDGVSGTWEGSIRGGELPPGVQFVLTLVLAEDGSISGTVAIPMGTGTLSGTYGAATGAIRGTITTEEGAEADFTGTVSGSSLRMTVHFQGVEAALSGERTEARAGGAEDGEGAGDQEEKKARAHVEIDFEGLEKRAIMLPVSRGDFGALGVNDKNQIIYVRREASGTPSIKLFDLDDEKKEEKTVAAGAGAFELSADGKKIAVSRGGTISIQKASAGATGKNVVTAGMTAVIDPPAEWKQIFTEVWRLDRDFLYVDNMHGVDWPAMRDGYGTMLADCVTREDVSYVIRELISEINIGHAYYREGPGAERGPSVAVGMLGVDWELHDGAYRIARVLHGAAWDVDARGPFTQSGCTVNEGEYVLAVNGVPIDTGQDPWAAFLGLAGQTITLTVSEKPVIDDDAREVAVKTIGNERTLRYRAWVEHNRRYVEEKSGGTVGYVYVPDTGVNGQDDLVRQYFGQIEKSALIIDERWNGGGQIPSRFIEILNRPVTNYWARRDGKDGVWPPDGHHGPKCMLINGLAGSGGDLFPWYFRQAGLGKLIGTRTWGGLVGISGNPGLIDGSGVTVPTFGFYETNGTWGVEGHGVDPDIEVVDDPYLMVDGSDPQLDVAIQTMLEEIQRHPYTPPHRPTPPDRSGMGIRDEDK